jgi:hypothetical protein
LIKYKKNNVNKMRVSTNILKMKISKHRFSLTFILFFSFALNGECQNIAPLGGYLKSNCINCDQFNQSPEYLVYAFAYFAQGEFIPDSINISFDESNFFRSMEKSSIENVCGGIVKVQYGPYHHTFYQDRTVWVFCKFTNETKFAGKNYVNSDNFLLSHMIKSKQASVQGTNESVTFKDCQLISCIKGRSRTFNLFGNLGSGNNAVFSFFSSNHPEFYGNIPQGCHINQTTGDITLSGNLDTGTYNITIGVSSEWGKGGLPIAHSNYVLTFKVLDTTFNTPHFLENFNNRDSLGIPFFNIENNQQDFSTSLGFDNGSNIDSFTYTIESILQFSQIPTLNILKTLDSTIIFLKIDDIKSYLPNLPTSISLVATSEFGQQCKQSFRTSFYLDGRNANSLASHSRMPLEIKFFPNPVTEDFFCYSEKSYSSQIINIYGQIVSFSWKIQPFHRKLDQGSKHGFVTVRTKKLFCNL